MRNDHAIGNNIQVDSLFLTRVPLTKNDPTAPYGGKYFFPDLPQITGPKICGIEILDGGVEIPTLQEPAEANLGNWSAYFQTSFLTLFEYKEGESIPQELIRQAPLCMFRLNDGLLRTRKKITPINARINWRASFIDLVGFAAPVPGITIYVNMVVYYNL
jgi:hypothetical protein